ncbi:MAG: TIGR04086 family membrane protein [Clostridiales bacterium]|nr:TIGR04086 family membrane protein [Clostridiales bacterium]
MRGKFVKYIRECALALVVSILFSLVLVLLSAMLFKIFGFDAKFVSVFNVVIKILSILIASIVCFKTPSDGWIRGIVFGGLFILFSHVLYGIISSSLTFGLSFFPDLVLGVVSGLVGGILSVNLKKRRV